MYRSKKLSMVLASIENKRVLHDFTPTTVGTTSEFTLINSVSQGDTQSSRNGNKIMCNYLTGNFDIKVDPSATVPTQFRVLFVYDKQTNGAAPTYAEIISPTAIYGLRNVNEYYRFKILYDKTFWVDNIGPSTKHVRFNKKFKLQTRFDSTTGVVSAISMGSIYMVVVSSDNTNQPTFQGAVRLGFYDN